MNEIENKYFIDDKRFNCPFCKLRSTEYKILGMAKFDETNDKVKSVMFVQCNNCKKVSMHIINGLLNSYLQDCNFIYNPKISKTYGYLSNNTYSDYEEKIEKEGIDNNIILHIPTSFFTIDNRIPKKMREALNEATTCYKNNAITGASACIRKSIYEFLNDKKATGKNYDDKIKSIKGNWGHITEYLDVLIGIKGMASDQVHESSLEKLNKKDIMLYINVLKEIFNEVYVIPEERKQRKNKIMKSYGDAKQIKKESKNDPNK